MDFFESVGKVVTDTAQIVVKKSSDMLECTKLTFTIKSEQEKIKGFYKEIGKTVYGMYKSQQPVSPEIADYCKAIDDIHLEIVSLKQTLAKLRNTKICPACKANINMGDAFCPICGQKQEIPKQDADEDHCCCSDDQHCDDLNEDNDCDCGCGCDCGDTDDSDDVSTSCKCSEDDGCGCGDEFKNQ